VSEIVWIIDISRKNPKFASPPRKGIKCDKCGFVNPLIAKYCINCGNYLNNEIRKKYDKLIAEIYEDIKKSDPDKDYVNLDDI